MGNRASCTFLCIFLSGLETGPLTVLASQRLALWLWTVRTKTRLSFGSHPEAAVTARRRHACGRGTLQPPEGAQLHALRCVLILLRLATLHCIPAWAAGVPKSVSARRSSTTRPSSKAASLEQP